MPSGRGAGGVYRAFPVGGDAIPLGARIVAVADVYDALTSDRPYRAALSPAAALARLAEQAGRTFDAAVVGALMACAGAAVP